MTILNIRKKLHKICAALIFILIGLNFVTWAQYKTIESEQGYLKIFALDVGQGDSMLIKTPNNLYGLIDTGKGTKVINELEAVLPLNYKELEFVLLTHPDADHVEGFIELTERYSIRNVIINKTTKSNELLDELKSRIHSKNFGVTELNDFIVDEVYFDVIWPDTLLTSISQNDSNDASIGLIIKYRNLQIFTAGDLSAEYENKSILNKDTNIDILKVGHHGSKTSTGDDFLSITKPEIALISVGMNNSYGHPYEEVLNNLTKHEVDIYRTDIHGRVVLISDGFRIKIGTYSGIMIEKDLE